jgi:RsiW-degrading membrane proteinase PrsW (M82 family)
MAVWISLAMAAAPALLILVYILRQDRARPEPKGLVLTVFLLGLAGIVPAVIVEMLLDSLTSAFAFSPLLVALFRAFVVAAFCEEGLKFLIVTRTVYRKPAFDEVMDGIVYAVVASLGFACMENILYVLDSGPLTALTRAFTAVPMHALAAGIMGYYLGKAKFAPSPAREHEYQVRGLSWAVFVHGSYNFLLFSVPFWGSLPALALFPLLAGSYLALRKSIRAALAADRSGDRSSGGWT